MNLQLIMISGIMTLAMVGCSQNEEVKQAPAEVAAQSEEVKQAPPEVSLQSDDAKFSYAMGLDIGNNLKNMGVTIDGDALIDALKVALNEGEARMTPEETAKVKQAVFQKKQQQMQEKRLAEGKVNKKAGERFLAENGKKEGVKTTASGLQYEVISEGEGPQAKAADTVKVHYVGTLLDGSEFDSSVKRGAPATFPLNAVIPGWTEGLQLMSAGSKYRLFIPSALGYGERGAGNKIGPNSVLIFEVELLEIVDAQAKAAAAKK